MFSFPEPRLFGRAVKGRRLFDGPRLLSAGRSPRRTRWFSKENESQREGEQGRIRMDAARPTSWSAGGVFFPKDDGHGMVVPVAAGLSCAPSLTCPVRNDVSFFPNI